MLRLLLQLNKPHLVKLFHGYQLVGPSTIGASKAPSEPPGPICPFVSLQDLPPLVTRSIANVAIAVPRRAQKRALRNPAAGELPRKQVVQSVIRLPASIYHARLGSPDIRVCLTLPVGRRCLPGSACRVRGCLRRISPPSHGLVRTCGAISSLFLEPIQCAWLDQAPACQWRSNWCM